MPQGRLFRDSGQPYDVVLRMPLASDDQLQPNQEEGKESWFIRVTRPVEEAFAKFDGYVIGVLGEYNKGKTFLVRKLSSEAQDVGDEAIHRHTKGISGKLISPVTGNAHSNEGSRKHLILDSAGLNAPVECKFPRHARSFAVCRNRACCGTHGTYR